MEANLIRSDPEAPGIFAKQTILIGTKIVRLDSSPTKDFRTAAAWQLFVATVVDGEEYFVQVQNSLIKSIIDPNRYLAHAFNIVNCGICTIGLLLIYAQ